MQLQRKQGFLVHVAQIQHLRNMHVTTNLDEELESVLFFCSVIFKLIAMLPLSG